MKVGDFVCDPAILKSGTRWPMSADYLPDVWTAFGAIVTTAVQGSQLLMVQDNPLRLFQKLANADRRNSCLLNWM
jgi:hypothetical protein